MTVSEFWHTAFISSLVNHSPKEAKALADESLAIAVEHWREVEEQKGRLVPSCIAYGEVPLTGPVGHYSVHKG